MIEAPPPPKLWLPPKPAIIRAWAREDACKRATFPFPVFLPGGAQFPAIVSTNTGNNVSVNTSYSAPLPASLVSGNLLVVICALWVNSAGSQWNTPSTWTQLYQTTGSGQLRSLAVFYKVSDGAEGSTLAMTCTVNAFKASTAYQISGYTGIPENGTTASSTTGAPDPASVTASWGAKKNLFIAHAANVGASTAYTAPSDYTNMIQDIGLSAGLARPRCGSCERFLEAATDDPGNFTASVANWNANTLVISGLG